MILIAAKFPRSLAQLQEMEGSQRQGETGVTRLDTQFARGVGNLEGVCAGGG